MNDITQPTDTTPVEPAKKPGRPRLYQNTAERQSAYMQRRKEQKLAEEAAKAKAEEEAYNAALYFTQPRPLVERKAASTDLLITAMKIITTKLDSSDEIKNPAELKAAFTLIVSTLNSRFIKPRNKDGSTDDEPEKNEASN